MTSYMYGFICIISWLQAKLVDNVVQLQGFNILQINDLVQGCSNSIANALELLQSCAKPLK